MASPEQEPDERTALSRQGDQADRPPTSPGANTPLYTYSRVRFLAVVTGAMSLEEYGEEIAAHVANQVSPNRDAPHYA